MLQWQVHLQSQPNNIIILIWLIALADHHYWIAPQIYDIHRDYYDDNEAHEGGEDFTGSWVSFFPDLLVTNN
jgi:hypothetical protein